MKSLTKYLSEKLVIIPSQVNEKLVIIPSQVNEKLVIIPSQVNEKLVINKKYNPYQYHPTIWDELREIIEQRYKEQGSGTEQDPVDFNDIDISGMTTFHDDPKNKGIFEQTEFEYIDISDWNVSNVKDMCATFYECLNLKSIGDISNWDVSNVEDMEAMFFACEKLESIGDLSNWNISNVRYMASMFDDCRQLKSIGDLSKWDVSYVDNMNYMFSDSGIINIPDWYKEYLIT